MRRSINSLAVSLLLSSVALAASDAQPATEDAPPPGTTFVCRFIDGPRAGHIQPLPGAQENQRVRLGSGCSDGASSTGTIIAQPADVRMAFANAGEPLASQTPLTTTCRFSSGPRAGESMDIAEVLGHAPVPVGSTCSDGASSMGTAVASATDTAGAPWSSAVQSGAAGTERAASTICQFMSGPKAHGWHDYAPSLPATLGSSCRDGMSSAGIVVASGHGQQY